MTVKINLVICSLAVERTTFMRALEHSYEDVRCFHAWEKGWSVVLVAESFTGVSPIKRIFFFLQNCQMARWSVSTSLRF